MPTEAPVETSDGDDYSLRFRSLLAEAMLRAALANAAYHREEGNHVRAMFAQHKADRRRKAITRAAKPGGTLECPNRLDDLRRRLRALAESPLDRVRMLFAVSASEAAPSELTADEVAETGDRVVSYLELGVRPDGPRNLRLVYARELSRPQTAWRW